MTPLHCREWGKTVLIYLCTTIFAITIGLVSVNLWEPGKALPEETKIELQETYRDNVGEKEEGAMLVKERRPLDFIVGIVPDNF